MPKVTLLAVVCCLGFAVELSADEAVSVPAESTTAPQQKFIVHKTRQIEGWTVHVDECLLDEQRQVGELALRILGNNLYQITLVVPPRRVEELRKVAIWIDFDHVLKNMQYHPNVNWLRQNGHDPAMAKGVQIGCAQRLINHQQPGGQPWAVLHELAHAYHDQVLGWNFPPVVKAFRQAQADGKLESVLRNRGGKQRHYALTNHKEFFAEMTEAYFGTNDFYPFVREELRTDFPEANQLMKAIWIDGLGSNKRDE